MRLSTLSGLICLLAGISLQAHADVIDLINAQRLKSCDGAPAPTTPLSANAALTNAAELIANGQDSRQAIVLSGYRGTHFNVIHLQKVRTERQQAHILARDHCDSINNPVFADIGVHRRVKEAWIVLASPYPLPTVEQSSDLAEQVLILVNQARAEARWCGNQEFSMAPPLLHSDLLQQAALVHAQDMSNNGLSGHEGSIGDLPAERLTQSGYRWSAMAENIACGQNRAEQIVEGWLASPRHCANVMNARFVHMGVAFAVNPNSKFGIYWTQVLAAPEAPPPPIKQKSKKRAL